jgi:hypothetical protein
MKKTTRILFHCRHTKKAIKSKKECLDCFNKELLAKDPNAINHEACQFFNSISPIILTKLKDKYKEDGKYLALITHLDQLIKPGAYDLKDMEECLLLIRLEYQK